MVTNNNLPDNLSYERLLDAVEVLTSLGFNIVLINKRIFSYTEFITPDRDLFNIDLIARDVTQLVIQYMLNVRKPRSVDDPLFKTEYETIIQKHESLRPLSYRFHGSTPWIEFRNAAS